MKLAHFVTITTLGLLSVTIAACSSDGTAGTSSGGFKRGYVARGGVPTCNPGQHCDNFICLGGCQSDDNCLVGTSCKDIDSVTKTGTCSETTTTADSGVATGKCDGLFDKLSSCGLVDATEVATAEVNCEQKFTADQIKVYRACY